MDFLINHFIVPSDVQIIQFVSLS